MKKIKYLSLLFILGFSYAASAQQLLSGTLIDGVTGSPLEAATVFVLNTTKGTTTNAQGEFQIELPEGSDSLGISYIGYRSAKIAVDGQQQIRARLQPDALTVDQIVVTASREAESRSTVPAAISTISAREITETKATRLDELLNRVPGVNMIDLGNEQHAMSIRQPIATNGVFLYLEDGIPIRPTGAFNHNALIEIDHASMQRIELMRGPSSSLYGSEAIGGAINFITKQPSLDPYARISTQGNTIGFRRFDVEAAGTFNRLGVSIVGAYAGRRDGFRDNSDYDKYTLNAKVNYALSAKTKLSAGMTYVDYTTDALVGTDSANFFNRVFPSQFEFGGRDVYALRANTALEHQWNDQHRSTFTLFFRDNYVDQNATHTIRDNPNDPLRGSSEISRLGFKSYGGLLRHKARFNWLNSSLAGGLSYDYSPTDIVRNYIDVARNEQGDYTSFTNPDSLLGNAHAGLFNSAAYLQYTFEPVSGLQVSLSGRYDHIVYDYDNFLDSTAFSGAPDSRDVFQAFTPKIGLIYKLSQEVGVYANYSQGFLPPQLSELYRGVKVPTLRQAEFANYELGAWFNLGDKANVEVNAYLLEGDDEIINVDLLDGSRERQNAGQTRHYGLEYALNIAPSEEWFFRFAGSNSRHEFVDYAEGDLNLAGNRMPFAPEWLANAQATYRPSYLPGFRIGLEWVHLGEYFIDNANSDTYEGYDLLHLRTGYEWKNLEIWCNVTNLTDELYSVNTRRRGASLDFRVGELRAVQVGLAYTFRK